LEIEDRKLFNTIVGTFKAKKQVTIKKAMIPRLSASKISMTLGVLPEESQFIYGALLGQDMMK
jgi:hypothetical protein